MLWILLASFCWAEKFSPDSIVEVRSSVSEAERKQREALGSIFAINKEIQEIAKKRAKLHSKVMQHEAQVKTMAQEVATLEKNAEFQQEQLNKRLRQIYQNRKHSYLQQLFSARSPLEFQRQHYLTKRMLDADHRHLKTYLAALEELQAKRTQLKAQVGFLLNAQKDVQRKEVELTEQMRQKSKLVRVLKETKERHLAELQDLRQNASEDAAPLAFFERKGTLPSPLDVPITREFGVFVDPKFRFRLMQKGLFYSSPESRPVRSIYAGKVVLANKLPGLGRTVIVDHGDNYYSVYAMNSRLKVREGESINEGTIVAQSGLNSPLFGPGLYFEIRHFTDAIDPRSWIKEPIVRTGGTE